MRKRITAGILALALLLAFAPAALAAASPLLRISAPETLPAVGKTFTVTAELSDNPGMTALECTLAFDAARVECTGVTTGSMLRGMLTAVNERYSASSAKVVAAAADAATGNGTVATFTFRVLAGGDANFRLTDIVFGDRDLHVIQMFEYYLMFHCDSETVTGDVREVGGVFVKSAETAAGKDNTGESSETGAGETPAAAASGTTFSDVPASFWGYSAIERAAGAGLAGGFPDGTFRPNAAVSRAQFVQMLWNLAGKPKASAAAVFTDVPADAWYLPALSWAVEAGCAGGVGGGRFDPNGSVTRQQAAAMLFRYAGGQSGGEALFAGIYDAQYSDSAAIAAWAKPAMYWAVFHEVISGVGADRIAPTAPATRAQVAAILLRYLDQNTGEEEA